jgi:putative aldouronate transport system permease protein
MIMRISAGERIFYALNYILLGIAGLSCVLPIIYLVSLSFSSETAVMSGAVSLWPIGFNLSSYRLLIEGTGILRAFWNNVLITVVGTLLSMGMTVLAAYPLSKSYFYCRRASTLLIIFTMIFVAGLIPNYLLIQMLGLIDTYWAIWLPGAISVYNLLVMKTFFENIPQELEDAARIDGCSETRLILQIFLPLSLPAIAALVLFYAVWYWNSFFNVLIYINSSSKHNLTVLVQQMIIDRFQQLNDSMQPDMADRIPVESVQAAGTFIMILPMLLIYPFIQKHFVKGVMIGSVKG